MLLMSSFLFEYKAFRVCTYVKQWVCEKKIRRRKWVKIDITKASHRALPTPNAVVYICRLNEAHNVNGSTLMY